MCAGEPIESHDICKGGEVLRWPYECLVREQVSRDAVLRKCDDRGGEEDCEGKGVGALGMEEDRTEGEAGEHEEELGGEDIDVGDCQEEGREGGGKGDRDREKEEREEGEKGSE